MKEFILPGAVKKASLPNGWVLLPSEPDTGDFGERWERIFISLFDEGVEIRFFYRGQPVDPESANFFKRLMVDKPALNGPEKLTPQEIVGLQTVMGLNNAGNNQYTNPQLASSADGPAFDLSEAATRHFSGRTILFIKGKFKSGFHYAGIFYNADESGQMIEEALIQANSSKKLNKYMGEFEQTLANLEWSQLGSVV